MTGTYQSKHGPVEGCTVSETPLRERAWTDGQRLARLRELAELWKAGDFEERECAEKLLAILDADGAAVSSNDVLGVQ